MILNKYINNITGLQIFQLLRFGTFILISIVFTKSHLTTADIGIYETLLFIAGIASFFWVTGLIQSFLPLYKNNQTFSERDNKVIRGCSVQRGTEKSPEIFNAFLLLSLFSFLAFLFVLFCKKYISQVLISTSEIPYFNLLLWYIFLSNPTYLIEYIYLLNNKVQSIIKYGLLSFLLQFILVACPIMLGYGIEYGLYGLIIISVFRLIWLFILLRKYALFIVSIKFIKEHISLGYPLILSALLSGSAQYIDAFLVANKFGDATFAIFRYGAREFPIVLLLANAFSNAMIPEFALEKKLKNTLLLIKQRSARLMHLLFPVTIAFLLLSNWLFPIVFNENFTASAQVFNIYLLLIISRLVFPQTILIGLKRTKIILLASFLEIIVNVTLSIVFINYWGFVGVAIATVVAYFFEKIVLIFFSYFSLRIKPEQYIPVSTHLFYSALTILLYFIIDFVVF